MIRRRESRQPIRLATPGRRDFDFPGGCGACRRLAIRSHPYLWLPNIEANGAADAPPDGGEPAFEVGPVDYLDNLDFVLMLAGEARRGSWSLRADVIYLDFSNQRSRVKTAHRTGRRAAGSDRRHQRALRPG